MSLHNAFICVCSVLMLSRPGWHARTPSEVNAELLLTDRCFPEPNKTQIATTKAQLNEQHMPEGLLKMHIKRDSGWDLAYWSEVGAWGAEEHLATFPTRAGSAALCNLFWHLSSAFITPHPPLHKPPQHSLTQTTRFLGNVTRAIPEKVHTDREPVCSSSSHGHIHLWEPSGWGQSDHPEMGLQCASSPLSLMLETTTLWIPASQRQVTASLTPAARLHKSAASSADFVSLWTLNSWHQWSVIILLVTIYTVWQNTRDWLIKISTPLSMRIPKQMRARKWLQQRFWRLHLSRPILIKPYISYCWKAF